MLKEATALPWAMGARLMVELRSTVRIPEEPRMTKSAAAGLVKIARICKMAQTPEEAQQTVQQQAMVDPNVVQALDYQQAESERQAMMAKIQELQMATEAAQAQAQMADQQAQAATQQQEQLMMQAQQAKQEQVNAVMESMQAKDQTLQVQVSSQQHRQQVAQFAQQMADQLKQLATTSPEEQQMQEQAAAEQEQQQQAAMQQQQQGQEQPVKKKTKQQQQEAQNSQENAQKQTAQAEQATAQDQQEMQGMQAQAQQPQQPQVPPMGGQPKMGSAKLQKIAARFKFARIRKQAQFSGTNEGYGESQGGSGQQGMFSYSSMGKRESLPAKQFAALRSKVKKREGTGKSKTGSAEAQVIGIELGVDWSRANFTPADLAKGMKIEEEHGSKDSRETAKVAIDHLRERGDYYDLLAKKVEEAPKTDGGESAAKEKQEQQQEKQGSFDHRRAMMIAQRVRLIKEGQLKKVCRDSADIAESHQLQLVKSAAKMKLPVVESGAHRLGRAGAYAALGAALGAAYEKSRLRAHEKKVGLDKPTQKEIDLAGKLVGAKELAKREPTYANKLRIHNIKYKIDMERLGREHPNRAALRGAGLGALGGFALGPFVHRVAGKIIKR